MIYLRIIRSAAVAGGKNKAKPELFMSDDKVSRAPHSSGNEINLLDALSFR